MRDAVPAFIVTATAIYDSTEPRATWRREVAHDVGTAITEALEWCERRGRPPTRTWLEVENLPRSLP